MMVSSLGFLLASYIPDLVEEADNLEMPMNADRKNSSKSCLSLGKAQPRKTENCRY